MSRRPTRQSTGVDMFPFLSVLCSVIGVLMLFILVIATTRVINSTASAVTIRPEELGGGSAEISDAEFDTLRTELDQLSRQMAQQQARLAEMVRLRNQLQVLLEVKHEKQRLAAGEQVVRGVDLNPRRKVTMVPVDGQAVTRRGIFIEVGFGEYTVKGDDPRTFTVDQLPAEDEKITTDDRPDSPLQKFLHELFQARDRRYIVLLIKPDGARAFDQIRNYLAQRYPHPQTSQLSAIDLGWEPFSQDWLYTSE